MYKFSLFFLCILLALIFSILIISQEFPCIFNHAFANVNYTYCDRCGEPLSDICPNGHRLDGDYCTICGLGVSHG